MTHYPNSVVITRVDGSEFIPYRSNFYSDAEFYAHHSVCPNARVFKRIEIRDHNEPAGGVAVWDASWENQNETA